MTVKRIVAPRQPPVLGLAAPTHASAADKKTTTAPREFLAPKPTVTVEAAPGRHSGPRFAPGEDVEVRSKFSQIPAGKRQLVIYARAKVISASAGTDSYLVQYPAASSIPSRTARVAASDVRAARGIPAGEDHSAVDGARPASYKRPSPSDQSESGADDGYKKARRTGKGVPMDALRRFFREHEEEEEKRKKAPEHDGELLPPKLRPETI